MAWKDNLLDARFRDVVFDCIGTTDSFPRATVEHDYPYVDGAEVEDMGSNARRISIRAVVFGDNYEAQLQLLMDALDTAGEGDLVHPVYGLIRAQVANYRVVHDADSPDEAQVEIEFLQNSPSAPFFDRQAASQIVELNAQNAAAAQAAAANLSSTVLQRLQAAAPLSALDGIRQAMTGPLLALSGTIISTLSGLDVLAYPRAWGNDISTICNDILDVRQWAENLEQDWISIQNDLNAFSIFSAAPSVASTIQSSGVPTETQVQAAMAATVAVNASVSLANAAGLVMAAESMTATMSPQQIENIANAARASIDATINQVRAIYDIEHSRQITEPMKDQAMALQDAARAVIEARPPLVLRTVKTDGNLRLVAHEFYGDANRAPELQRLNNLRLPNFVQAGDQLHAYAS